MEFISFNQSERRQACFTSFQAAIGLFEQYLIASAILIGQDIRLVWVKNSSQLNMLLCVDSLLLLGTILCTFIYFVELYK